MPRRKSELFLFRLRACAFLFPIMLPNVIRDNVELCGIQELFETVLLLSSPLEVSLANLRPISFLSGLNQRQQLILVKV